MRLQHEDEVLSKLKHILCKGPGKESLGLLVFYLEIQSVQYPLYIFLTYSCGPIFSLVVCSEDNVVRLSVVLGKCRCQTLNKINTVTLFREMAEDQDAISK